MDAAYRILKKTFFTSLLISSFLTLSCINVRADVYYDDVPSYNQNDFDAVCAETAIAMVVGWYDTNKYTTNWKRFVKYGGNSSSQNFLGIYALVSKIVDSFNTDGSGISKYGFTKASTIFPAILNDLDSNANFIFENKDLTEIIEWEDIKYWLDNYNIGLFSSTICSYIQYYKSNSDATQYEFDRHTTTCIGYFENKKPTDTNIDTAPPVNISSNWITVKSTWTNDPYKEEDPLWINWDDVGIEDDIFYGVIIPGGIPTVTSDDTDDDYEDNDLNENSQEISIPFDKILELNDIDVFYFYCAKGTLNIEFQFLDESNHNESTIVLGKGQSVFPRMQESQFLTSTNITENIPESGYYSIFLIRDTIYSNTQYNNEYLLKIKNKKTIVADNVSYSFTTAPNTNILINFQTEIDETSLLSNISIVGSESGNHAWSYSYNDSIHQLTLNPVTDFRNNETVTINLFTGLQSSSGGYLDEQYQFTFTIRDASSEEPTFISVSANSSDRSIEPYDSITISGTAAYNTGEDVDGTATIFNGESYYSAAVTNGSFSRIIPGPSLSRNIDISVSDGTLTGTDSISISVDSEGDMPSYDLKPIVAYDYKGDDESIEWWPKKAFRTTDERVIFLDVFENMSGSGNLDLMWRTFRPDGTQHFSDQIFEDALNLSWGWGWAAKSRLISENYMESHPGRYRVKFYVDDDRKATRYFVVGWDFTQHFLCKDHDEDWEPIGETNTFSPDDPQVMALHHFEYQAQDINVKTEFIDPNGIIQYSSEYLLDADGLDSDEWYYTRNHFSKVYIAGTEREYLCGDWTVKFHIQNPGDNSWEQKYTDYFRLEEKVDPIISVNHSPSSPVESQNITFTVLASDNNHLQSVVLHWDNGTEQTHTWNSINAGTLNQNYILSNATTDQPITYWAEVWDESGNRSESSHASIVIMEETVSVSDFPTGDMRLQPGASGSYQISGSSTNTGSALQYQFDWGDGTQSDWGDPTQSYIWNNSGEYFVRARAQSVMHTNRISDWSNRLKVTVADVGWGCNYTVDPLNKIYTAASGIGSITITTSPECEWSATTNEDWITITSGSSGTGNGTLNFTVAENTTPSSRTGTLVVAGETVTIEQADVNQDVMDNIPLTLENWHKHYCGNWEEMEEGLKIYGTVYREGNRVRSNQIYNFIDSDTFIKSKVYNSGQFGSFNFGLANIVRFGGTTSYSYNGSTVINENTWYFTRLRINPDKTYEVVTCTEDYDINGGTPFINKSGTLTDAQWDFAGKTFIEANFGDQRAGTSAYQVIGEAKTTGTPVSTVIENSYDFEADVDVPSAFNYTGVWEVDSALGLNSSQSIRVDATETVSLTLNVVDAAYVRFSPRASNSNLRFYIDSVLLNTRGSLDDSTCWNDVVVPIPGTGVKTLKWEVVSGSTVWIDDIIIYKAVDTEENQAPIVSDGTFTTEEDTDYSGTLSASDPDNDPLTYYISTNGTKGEATITNAATGAFTYSPTENETGSDSFTFKVNDGKVDSINATVTVAISAVNDAPESPSDPTPADSASDVSTDTSLAWSCSDVDGDSLTYDVYLGTANPPVTAVSSSQTKTSFDPGALTPGILYYWRIVANDGHDISTEGPVWSFTTRDTCQYTVIPEALEFEAIGGSAQIDLIANYQDCEWSASSDDWITITSDNSGTGDGTVAFTVAENTTTEARTGTLVLAGETVTIEQAVGVHTLITLSEQNGHMEPENPEVTTGADQTITITADEGFHIESVLVDDVLQDIRSTYTFTNVTEDHTIEATFTSLYVRGGGLVYDAHQDLTWLQDANYMQTSGADDDGLLNWDESMSWAEAAVYHDTERDIYWHAFHLPDSARGGYNGATNPEQYQILYQDGLNRNLNDQFSVYDDFDGNSLDTTVWKQNSTHHEDSIGPSSSVHDGYLDLRQDATDNGGQVVTRFAPKSKIRVAMTHNMHPGGNYFFPRVYLESAIGERIVMLYWQKSSYTPDNCNDSANYNRVRLRAGWGNCNNDVYADAVSDSFYDRWTTAVLEYDMSTGIITADLDNDGTTDIQTTVPVEYRVPITGVGLNAYGWNTGHWHRIDEIRIEDGTNAAANSYFNNMHDDWYWTKTGDGLTEDLAWGYNMGSDLPSGITRTDEHYAWLVADGDIGSMAMTVDTPVSSAITSTTATLGGRVSQLTGGDITRKGIYWSTDANFAPGTGTEVSETGTFGTEAFTLDVTGLPSGTPVYFRAFAEIADAGMAYSDVALISTLNIYDLNISSSEGGAVTSPGERTFTHEAGTVVEITATAAPGFQFAGWSGDVADEDKMVNPISLTMDGNKTVVATFAVLPLAPVIQEGDSVTITMSEDGTPILFALTLHASDINGDPLSWRVKTQANHGTAVATGQGNAMIVQYDPAANWHGSDSFEVEVSDGPNGAGDGLSDTITVNVTVESVNDAPASPSSPTPANSASDVSIDTSLEWSCSDVDGDILTYDVYLGTANPPATAVALGQTTTTFDPGTLAYGSTYYWKLVTKDGHEGSTEGPVWSFTTRDTCKYTVTPENLAFEFEAAGGSGQINLDANYQDCEWSATSNDDWITITSGTPGTGDGTVTFTVAENTTSRSRTGTLTVAGETMAIEQAVGVHTIITLSGQNGHMEPENPEVTTGTDQTITITADEGFHIESVLIDDVLQDIRSTYTFTNVTEDHTIEVTFTSLYIKSGGLVYDAFQDLTWLQDANYMQTSGADDDGRMNWEDAMAWSQNAVYHDTERGIYWHALRLPDSHSNGSDEGIYPEAYQHLYSGGLNGDITHQSYFENIQAAWYWCNTDRTLDGTHAWGYDMDTDTPGEALKTEEHYAWLVADGDIGSMALTVDTPVSSAITSTTATLGGTVSQLTGGNVTRRGIYWSTDVNFTPDTGTEVSETGTFGADAFTLDVTELPSGTPVYFRAFAEIADAGMAYSDVASLQSLTQYTLVIDSNDGGTVTTPGEGSFTYDEGAKVTLTAVADPTYVFDTWSGDLPEDVLQINPVEVTMDGSRQIHAHFKLLSGKLTVTPSDDFTASGCQGGEFTPSNTAYTLTNIGDASITWSADANASWLTVTPGSGTLAPNDAVDVQVSINGSADILSPDTYSDTVSFSNSTNGIGTTSRGVSLSVTSCERPDVDLGSGNGCPGGTVRIPITLANITGTDISAVSADIEYDTEAFSDLSAEIGPAGSDAGKTVITSSPSPGVFRVGVMSFGNNSAIQDGVVAYLSLTVKDTVTIDDVHTLANTPTGSSPEGTPVSIDGVDGTITIVSCLCGDCNNSSTVTIDEVQSAVNMYLALQAVESCADCNRNGAVTIDELQKIVNHYLGILAMDQMSPGASNEESVLLDLGSTHGKPGDTIQIPIELSNILGTDVSAVSIDIQFDTAILENPDATVGPAATAAGKTSVCNELTPGTFRVGILSLGNNTPIEDGIVAYVSFTIKKGAFPTVSDLINLPSGSTPSGDRISISGTDGSIEVERGRAVALPGIIQLLLSEDR